MLTNMKPVHRQGLVTKLPVKALAGVVLPRVAQFDQHTRQPMLERPRQQHRADELRTGSATATISHRRHLSEGMILE